MERYGVIWNEVEQSGGKRRKEAAVGTGIWSKNLARIWQEFTTFFIA
jgi:hypothetical protein